MAHLFAYFDESGKRGEHPIVAFSGFVDGFNQWRVLQEKWLHLLVENGIEEFHASKAIRYSQPYGKMARGNAETRTKNILPFIRAITEELALGIAIAVDVRAYEAADPMLHRAYGRDPHYFAFFLAINEILNHPWVKKDHTIGLILDDEEEKCVECYRLLNKLKLANPRVRESIQSICFMSDRNAAPLQTCDLFAYLTRSEAQQRFLRKEYPYRDLFLAFQQVSPNTGKHLHFSGGFYDGPALLEFLEQHLEMVKRKAEGEQE